MEAFKQGSPEWSFFAEFYQVCKRFYGMPKPEMEKQYEEFCRDTDALQKKYKQVSPELDRFSRCMIIGLIDYFNAEYKAKGGLQ